MTPHVRLLSALSVPERERVVREGGGAGRRQGLEGKMCCHAHFLPTPLPFRCVGMVQAGLDLQGCSSRGGRVGGYYFAPSLTLFRVAGRGAAWCDAPGLT